MNQDEVKYDIFKYGSAWLKSDFHLHTKSDKQFVYKNDENSFIKEYVAQLKKQNIRIGVISNHNKFNYDEFKNMRKKARKEEIFLLPGVELSVGDGANGVHVVIVFSNQWISDGNDYINPFLSSMFTGKTPVKYESEDGRCDKNILQLVESLGNYNKDYFLVFAHVEQRSGLWNELEGGRLSDFSSDRYLDVRNNTLGFQKVRSKDKKEQVIKHLNGWYPAEVEGSDCKSIEEIGNKSGETYLKVGDFSFEAVKYALIAHEDRVRNKPIQCKHSYVKSISFEGGVLDGQTISFSSGLNTLIGVRGSGKSSILEALRYSLDYSFGEKVIDKEYKTKLVEHTLGSGGKTKIVAVDKHNQHFEIRRILNQSAEVYVNNKLQPGISIKETIINKPIYFGQKDLSSSSEGFEKELVEKLVGDNLQELRIKIEEKKQSLIEVINIFQKLSDVDERIKEQEQIIQDSTFNIEKFTEHGVAEKFAKQTSFDSDSRKINNILKDIELFKESLEGLINQHEDNIKNHLNYDSQQNKVFFKSFFQTYNEITLILDNLNNDIIKIDNVYKTLQTKKTEFNNTKKAFDDEFAGTRRKVEEELREKGITSLDLEEYPTLKGKIDNATNILKVLEKQRENAQTIKFLLITAIAELNDLWHEEFILIKKLLEPINSEETSLIIRSNYKGDKEDFLAFAKMMFRGSGIRESTLSNLVNEYADFGEMYKDFENAKGKAGSSPELFETYFLANLKDLLTYQVKNKFIIEYEGKELKHHSLGQRASALILFVLNQKENDLIIIDQPEDDLDNQTVYKDVIKLIKKFKSNTQFIFATHNANFPVLGDAEQIHSCQYEDDSIITKSGSIDSPIIQKEIVDIMEGGEDAFNKRKEIYGIWR